MLAATVCSCNSRISCLRWIWSWAKPQPILSTYSSADLGGIHTSQSINLKLWILFNNICGLQSKQMLSHTVAPGAQHEPHNVVLGLQNCTLCTRHKYWWPATLNILCVHVIYSIYDWYGGAWSIISTIILPFHLNQLFLLAKGFQPCLITYGQHFQWSRSRTLGYKVTTSGSDSKLGKLKPNSHFILVFLLSQPPTQPT